MNRNKLLLIGILLTIFLMLNVVNAVDYNSESNLTIDDSISNDIVDVDGEINDDLAGEKIEHDKNNIGAQYNYGSWCNSLYSEKSFEDVQRAINSSSEHEVIQLPECISGQDSINIINKSLEIRGVDNGTDVYSNSSNFVFYVTSNINSSIVFKNLNFYSLNDIYARGVEITLINCNFINSDDALYSFNSNSTLINCNFTNCFSDYGLIECYYRECIFDNCLFQNNSAENYAIISTQKCNVDINKSVFRNNSQIYLSRSNSKLSIADSLFDGNYGSNIISNDGDSYFYNSSFMHNGDNIIRVSCCYDDEWDGDYVNCTVFNCSFIENNEWSASLDIHHANAFINSCRFLNTHGFAIDFWQESFVQINNSLFENYTESIIYGFGSVWINNSYVMNNSVDERDAIIWCRGYDDVINITVENSHFYNNKNLLIKSEGNTDLINSNFTNNFNLANIKGNATVSYCNFIDNNLCDVLIEVSSNAYFIDSNFTNNFIRWAMIAFDYESDENMISRCTFKSNHGAEGIIITGSASVYDCIFSQNDLESISNAKSILNSVFISNTKRIIGGANLIDNCSFINNNIDYYGLIRNNINNICIISNSKFIKNSIEKSINTGVDMGDIIDLWGCDFILEDCIFSNNTGENYLINSNSGKVNISNCNFSDYNICVLNVAYGDAIIGNCQFNKNNGGISAHSSNLNIHNSNFTNNFYSTDVGCGAAIYSTLGDLTVINCNFNGNTVNSEGGAIYFAGTTLIIKNSNFISNSAKSFGGAIYSDYTNFNLINSNFSNNYAQDGGALYIFMNYGPRKLNIEGTKFLKNSARYYGGAIFAWSEGNQVTISDSEFINNHARTNALHIFPKKISIINSKFLNNYGKESVFAFKNAVIDNSYFYGNYLENDDDSFVMDILGTSSIIDSKFVENSKESKYASFISENKISITNDGKTRTFNGVYVFDDNLNAYDYFNFIFKPGKIIYNSGDPLKFKVYKGYTKKTDFLFDSFNLKVFTGKKYIVYEKDIDFVITSKGIVILRDISKLDVGSHKVEVTGLNKRIIGYVKIVKANTIVKSSNLVAKFKKSNYFKVTIKHKTTKKFIKNVKINLKVFDGKKYKIYKLKTNKKGVAKFNTKKLSKGKHKVIISSKNKNYKISSKSKITIK